MRWVQNTPPNITPRNGGTVSMRAVLPPGPTGPTGAPGPGSAAWAPSTAVTTGAIRQAPDGSYIRSTASRTTRATFDATEEGFWTSLLADPTTVDGKALSASYAAQMTTVSKTSAYTAGAQEFVEADASGGTFTVTGPAAGAAKRWGVKKVNGTSAAPGNKVTISYLNSAGAATVLDLTLAGESKVFRPAGSGYRVESGDTPRAGLDVAYAAKVAARRALPRTVSGVGSMLVAPHRNQTDTASSQTKRITADESCNGIEINSYSGAAGNGVYGVFGKDTTSSTWRAVMSVEEGWTGTGDDGNFPSNGFQHAGIVSRFSTSSDFAVVLMFSPASGEIQIAAKVADTETVVRRVAVAGGIAWGQKILLEVSVGTTGCQCRAWDYATGTLLDDYTYTLTAGTPASGYFAFHTYSCRAKVWGVDGGPRGWDPTTFAPLFGGQGIWASNAATYAVGGPRVTSSGLIDVYSDGTNGSPNEWVGLLLPVKMSNFVLRGTVRLESGRMFGFRFYTDAHNTQGYSFTYDNNTPKFSLKKGDVNAASEIKAWTVTALTAATDYPFELTVNNGIYSLRINGATYAYRDASYTGPGYVGLCGYGSRATYRDLVWTPDPLTSLV